MGTIQTPIPLLGIPRIGCRIFRPPFLAPASHLRNVLALLWCDRCPLSALPPNRLVFQWFFYGVERGCHAFGDHLHVIVGRPLSWVRKSPYEVAVATGVLLMKRDFAIKGDIPD